MPKSILIPILVAFLGVLAYFIIQGPFEKANRNLNMSNLILKSSAFKEGETIPPKFTCDGENVSPLLEIKNMPANTKSLALVVEDLDAPRGPFVHWVLFNIDSRTQHIEEDSIPFGAKQGVNDFKNQRYGGPCPPRGNPPHRYLFKLYALDSVPDLAEGVANADLEKAMAGHILDQTVLTGRYARQ